MGAVKHPVRVVSDRGFEVPVRRQPPLVVGYEHFRLERQGALLSPKTLIYYDETVLPFLRWLEAEGVRRFDEVDVGRVRIFRAHLAARVGKYGRPLAPKTILEYHRAIVCFLRWARREGYAVDSRILELTAPRVPDKEPEVGTSRALAELTYFVESATLPQAGDALSSRVDVYADFQGWVPRPRDYERFVTRSRRNTWHVAVHHDGRQFTGFTFGRDAMVARLYDKGAEIAHSGKSWMRAIWGDRLDPTKPVWRVEFQLRREVLSDCNLSEPEEVLRRRQDLWSYATRWLSLRSPRPGVRRTRWPVAGAWLHLSRLELGAPQSPLVRHRIKEHDQSVLVRGLTGYASSLAAVTGVSDLDVAMLVSRRRVGEYMVATGRDFRDLVAAKRERRL